MGLRVLRKYSSPLVPFLIDCSYNVKESLSTVSTLNSQRCKGQLVLQLYFTHQPVNLTCRPVKLTCRPVKSTCRPVKLTCRPMKSTWRPVKSKQNLKCLISGSRIHAGLFNGGKARKNYVALQSALYIYQGIINMPESLQVSRGELSYFKSYASEVLIDDLFKILRG
jgi:hypothetical protein